MFALVYVSQSTLPRGDIEDVEIAQIVQWSKQWNAANEITGALMHTGGHFVQWLEGDEDIVRELMSCISRDARHRNVTVLREGPADARLFGAWSLAYRGRSTFADGLANHALTARDTVAIRRLSRLLQTLGSPDPQPGSAA